MTGRRVQLGADRRFGTPTWGSAITGDSRVYGECTSGLAAEGSFVGFLCPTIVGHEQRGFPSFGIRATYFG